MELESEIKGKTGQMGRKGAWARGDWCKETGKSDGREGRSRRIGRNEGPWRKSARFRSQDQLPTYLVTKTAKNRRGNAPVSFLGDGLGARREAVCLIRPQYI